MRQLILSGVPGAGKTKLARHLVAKNGFIAVENDQAVDRHRKRQYLSQLEQAWLARDWTALAAASRVGPVVIEWGYFYLNTWQGQPREDAAQLVVRVLAPSESGHFGPCHMACGRIS
jgi:hypothetical protein